MTNTPTACTYDCPDACGLLAEGEGQGLRLRGDPDHPVAAGFLCQRVRRHPARLASPSRLASPLLRRPEGFVAVGWDEALELAAGRLAAALREHGPASVVSIVGGGSLGLSKALVQHSFCSLGPVTTVRGGLCGEAGEEAQRADFGDAASHDYSDLDRAAAVVLWGKNPVATGVHLVPWLARARRRGAPVVLVEPRPTESSGQASRLVRVAPSGDGLLALAVLRTIRDRGALDPVALDRVENRERFEAFLGSPELEPRRLARRAGASTEDLELLASLYSGTRPVATWVGWGLQRRLSGGRNLRAIDALVLLSGNLGLPGGGASFTSTRRRGLDLSMLARPSGRTIGAATLGRDLAALAAPPARFVHLACANPVTSSPDSSATARALRSSGFVVVAEAFATDTARAADLVLPVRLMLEEDDLVGSYQHHHLAVVRKAAEPPEGARSDVWIVRELRRRAGLEPDPLLEEPARALERMTAPWFGAAGPRVTRNPHHDDVPFAGRFPTPTGRATLLAELPETLPEAPGYPLVLMTPSARGWQTSQLEEERQAGPATCFVHPAAARAAGLGEGELGRLESPVGEMEVAVRLEARLPAELVVVHRGGWVLHGRGVNVLVEARETDLGGGAAFYDQRVRLGPAGRRAREGQRRTRG